eukprot:TRINITY_DN90_c0_g1_i1.p1 TRINITY_DN90_c0_g1~~TRINITY_DN90_c0_g1_i1.p1  ORF type:complete len:216 (-),score=34.51 TRINITY_DN90_c0_g1_i1:75-689(-)
MTSSEQPVWIPASAWSPLYHTKLKPYTSNAGQDRRIWEIRKYRDEWQTLFGNRALTSGVHYWEFKVVNFQNYVMFGIVALPSTEYFNVDQLWSHLGNVGKSVLSKYSLSYYLQPTNWNYAWGANRGAVLDLGTTNYNGCRIGLSLDLVKYELTLFFFLASNSSGKPDKQILLGTLLKGRKYYPVFSLHHDETVLELTTSIPVPV